MHRKLFKTPLRLIAIMLVFVAASWVHAQTSTGAISGTATDPTGAKVVGADRDHYQ